MTVRNIIGTLVVIGIVLAFVFAPPKLRTWRQSRQVKKEIALIQEAIREIQNSPAPGADLIQSASTGRWDAVRSVPRYVVFSNGWAVYKSHSSHDEDGMDDLAVLKIPDGPFYLSGHHFEYGIQADTHAKRDSHDHGKPSEIELEFGDHLQPADAKDFLENGGRWQGWYQFSQDGKLQCIVRSPVEDHRREVKGLWVWIGAVENGSTKTLFQKKYSILAARDMFWTANWEKKDEIIIDVFDYGGNSPRMMIVDYPKRLVSTLIFQRDRQGGLFIEKTNISRVSSN